jgi:two-component system, NarL family, response regulator DesR
MSEHNSGGNGSVAGRPAVGVVAPSLLARTLAAALEHDGLDAHVRVKGRSYELDALVIAVETPTGGAAAIREHRGGREAARVVVVAERATPAEARQLMVDDVPGLVLDSQATERLAPTVRAVLSGQICYPVELMPTRLRSALSSREKQVLGMVVLGFGNAEIAAKLHVSESTVKSHLSSAFATMGVGSRKQAVALILDPDAGFGTGILAITGSGPTDREGG